MTRKKKIQAGHLYLRLDCSMPCLRYLILGFLPLHAHDFQLIRVGQRFPSLEEERVGFRDVFIV